jgi:hypothetical protein
MSLDISLIQNGKEVFSTNITHNLNNMAKACGVYYACWRPYEINCNKAKHILPMLKDAVEVLKADKEHYKKFDSKNGWGTYEEFLPWLESYVTACENYPDAKIDVSR